MKLDAPQLSNTRVMLSANGLMAQFELTNRVGDTLAFRVSYRQLGQFAQAIRRTALGMRERLKRRGEPARAELLTALSAAPMAKSMAFTKAPGTGDPIIYFDTDGAGTLAIRLPPDLVDQLHLRLASDAMRREPKN